MLKFFKIQGFSTLNTNTMTYFSWNVLLLILTSFPYIVYTLDSFPLTCRLMNAIDGCMETLLDSQIKLASVRRGLEPDETEDLYFE